jgi:hypothetical protein
MAAYEDAEMLEHDTRLSGILYQQCIRMRQDL